MDMRGRPLLLAMALAPTLCFSPVATAEPATEVSAATPVLTAATRDAALKASKARLSRAYINPDRVPAILARLEEHTSQFQSLMRNSYAVFYLKTKNLTLEQSST